MQWRSMQQDEMLYGYGCPVVTGYSGGVVPRDQTKIKSQQHACAACVIIGIPVPN